MEFEKMPVLYQVITAQNFVIWLMELDNKGEMTSNLKTVLNHWKKRLKELNKKCPPLKEQTDG